MAQAKIIAGNNINNGIATVNGGVMPASYSNDARNVIFASGDQLNLFRELNGRYRADNWEFDYGALPASTGDVASANGVNAVVFYGAVENVEHSIRGINYSYAATPTGGSVKIESPVGTTIWGPQTVTAAGPGFFEFPKGLAGAIGKELVVTLASGGAIATNLSVKGHYLK